jgi:hypothetical protein
VYDLDPMTKKELMLSSAVKNLFSFDKKKKVS